MLRNLLGTAKPDLERHLVRKSVDALAADRDPCRDCGRTPLVGEEVHLYAGDGVVCALCRARRRRAPERSVTVHQAEHGQTVRLRRDGARLASP